MLIIIEGPDCARKTTLASDVMTRLAVTYPDDTLTLLHRGPPTRHPLDEYVTPILDYRPGAGKHIVCDRWHWGEWVYPRLLDRPTKMDHAVFSYVEAFLRSRGAVTVLLSPPISEVEECIRTRGDDTVVPDHAFLMRSLFNDARALSVTAANRLTDTVTPDGAIAVAYGAETHAVACNDLVTAVGSPEPLAVIFGDVRACAGLGCNHAVAHETNGPAFMPYPGTSGHYLFNALNGWGDGVMYANACDVDDPLVITKRYPRAPVVALGVNAHKRLTDLGVPHAAVPHPQYVRRFHHASAVAYGHLITEIIGTERNELQWRP